MRSKTFNANLDMSRKLWGDLPLIAVHSLQELTHRYCLSISTGDLLFLEGRWYVERTLGLRHGVKGVVAVR